MEFYSFENELECLRASYNPSEFEYLLSNGSPILKFSLPSQEIVSFELSPQYPQCPPSISVSSVRLTNAGRNVIENNLKEIAQQNVGSPMIMDLVIAFTQLVAEDDAKRSSQTVSKLSFTDPYNVLILIDHMRQKKKYTNTLCSWASELCLTGSLIFFKRLIFLLLEGSKKNVKEFITRLKTVCLDVDSSGKPCKEKMAKVLLEGDGLFQISRFSVIEISTDSDLERYMTQSNAVNIFQDVIRPIICKSKS